MRNAIRERVGRDRVCSIGDMGRLVSLLIGKRWDAGGAKKSESEPVKRRAMVEVSATVITCVDGNPAEGGALEKVASCDSVCTIVPSWEDVNRVGVGCWGEYSHC